MYVCMYVLIFPRAVFRAAPQLTERLEEASHNWKEKHNLIVICSVGAFILFIIPLQG